MPTLTNGQKGFFNWAGLLILVGLAIVGSVAYAHTTFVDSAQYNSDMLRLERQLTRIEDKIDSLPRRGPSQGR